MLGCSGSGSCPKMQGEPGGACSTGDHPSEHGAACKRHKDGGWSPYMLFLCVAFVEVCRYDVCPDFSSLARLMQMQPLGLSCDMRQLRVLVNMLVFLYFRYTGAATRSSLVTCDGTQGVL